MFKTSDGGQTCQVQHVGSGSIDDLDAISMADADHGLAVGWFGTVLRTTDRGLEWVPEAVPPGYGNVPPDVKAIDADTAWISGGDGYVAVTKNGGAIWTREDFAPGLTDSFEAIEFVDADRGFAGSAGIFPHGGIGAGSGSGDYVCQQDLGYDRYGLLTLAICGSPLQTGSFATLEAHNAV